MKASELRIGNLVLRSPSSDYTEWKETIVNVTYLDLISQNPNDFKPIPLTEEWLVKFGFEQDIDDHWCLRLNLVKYTSLYLLAYFTRNIVTVFDRQNLSTGINIECVHQLQNLYFAITGEELTIKAESAK